jgi:hypothetical protein
MSNEDKTPIGSSEENRIVPDQEDNGLFLLFFEYTYRI